MICASQLNVIQTGDAYETDRAYFVLATTHMGDIMELLFGAALSLICMVTCCFIGRRIEITQEAATVKLSGR